MFVYTLIRTISNILCTLFLQSAIGKLITLSENRLKRFLMFSSSFLLAGMVIFLGDFANILPTFYLQWKLCKKNSHWTSVFQYGLCF